MSNCGVPMYDADGGPKCMLPNLHIWNGVNLGDDHSAQIGSFTYAWPFTYCWKLHGGARKAYGINCTEPVGHDS